MPRVRSYGSKPGLSAGTSAYRYELAPWAWGTAPFPFWRLPASAVGGVDLRPLPAQALAGGPPQGVAFAACRQSPGGVALASSFHMSETPATAPMRDAWQAGAGYRPAGDTLTDLLWDQLTAGSDPSGQAGPRPLVPGPDNVLRLVVPGHSEVKAEAFRWGHHPHTNRLRDLLRRQFEAEWERTGGHDHCRRVLDLTCEKYRVADWREFVPNRLHAHVPGRLPHATTVTESFPGTSVTLGGDLPWTELSETWANAGGLGQYSGGGVGYARADSNLSGSDHYAQAVIHSITGGGAIGPAARFAAASNECYIAFVLGTDLYLQSVAAGGTATNISGPNAITPALPEAYRLECSGSTVRVLQAGVQRISVTNPTVGGNVRGGLIGFAGGTFDDFEAADVGGGGGAAATAGKLLLLGCGG